MIADSLYIASLILYKIVVFAILPKSWHVALRVIAAWLMPLVLLPVVAAWIVYNQYFRKRKKAVLDEQATLEDAESAAC